MAKPPKGWENLKPSAEEFQRGRWDFKRWCWVYFGVLINPGQDRMGDLYLRRTDSRWRAFFLWLMIAAGNRAGKTLGLALIIAHSCTYRMGLQPPDDITDAAQVEHWGHIPYHWWHFAVEQGPAEQLFNELALLWGGVHPAQKHGCPWSDQVGGADKIVTLTDTGLGPWCTGAKERGEYVWIRFAPEFGGAEIHFRSTKAKALSSIGQNMHGVSFDEAGLESNLNWLISEVLHARRLGTGGQFILISTPSIETSVDFQDLWATGDPEDPFRERYRASMRMSSRENIGYGLDEETFDRMIEGQSEDWIAQNIDGKFIQAALAWFHTQSVDAIFNPNLPVEEAPQPGAVYIHALDPGLKDKCWSMVVKVLPSGKAIGVSLTRQSGKQTARGIVLLGKRDHHKYAQGGKSWIETGVDTTALGGHMFRDLLEDDDENYPGIPVRTVEFGGVSQVKRKMLSDARTAIEDMRIEFPTGGYWPEVRKQLRNYKLLDRKIEQDLVMEVSIVVKLLRAAPTQSERVPARFEYGVPEPKANDGLNSAGLRRSMTAHRLAKRAAVAAALTDTEDASTLRRDG
jgi:hypothetical protein